MEDDYSPIKQVDEDWGELKTYDIPTDSTKQRFTWVMYREKAKTPEDKEAARKALKRAINQEEAMKKQDMELFCKILKTQYRCWWT